MKFRLSYMSKILFTLIVLITVCSCTKTPTCTSGIIFHQVKITDSLGKAVLLDKFFTVCTDKKDTLHIQKYYTDSLLYYPLIDDRNFSLFQKDSPLNFKFIGIKGKDTINSPYVFKYDGCHIALVSGVKKILYQK